jgi:Na+/proline symporter
LQLAAKLKLNAPYAHTFLEIIGTRWGTFAHVVFMFFGSVGYLRLPISECAEFLFLFDVSLATNIIVSSMLILGGSATVSNLTGMSTIAVSLWRFPRFYTS